MSYACLPEPPGEGATHLTIFPSVVTLCDPPDRVEGLATSLGSASWSRFASAGSVSDKASAPSTSDSSFPSFAVWNKGASRSRSTGVKVLYLAHPMRAIAPVSAASAVVCGKRFNGTAPTSPSRRSPKLRSVFCDADTRAVRSPVISPSCERSPRSTPPVPVVSIVPQTSIG